MRDELYPCERRLADKSSGSAGAERGARVGKRGRWVAAVVVLETDGAAPTAGGSHGADCADTLARPWEETDPAGTRLLVAAQLGSGGGELGWECCAGQARSGASGERRAEKDGGGGDLSCGWASWCWLGEPRPQAKPTPRGRAVAGDGLVRRMVGGRGRGARGRGGEAARLWVRMGPGAGAEVVDGGWQVGAGWARRGARSSWEGTADAIGVGVGVGVVVGQRQGGRPAGGKADASGWGGVQSVARRHAWEVGAGAAGAQTRSRAQTVLVCAGGGGRLDPSAAHTAPVGATART